MAALEFPEGKKFAFTIFDDTDDATVENVRPVYELLLKLGMATTKSVWVLPARDSHDTGPRPHTFADRDYMDFIGWLIRNGFEIAFHNASSCSSKREDTISALENFREVVGYYPKAHANHESNKENIYWGFDRLDLPLTKAVYKAIKKLAGGCPVSEGHRPGSPYFWGDVCRRRIRYVRNLVFREINLLRVNPTMPYSDPKRPFVKFWFSSCEGADVQSFNRLVSSGNQDRLEKEGGVCIMYTHFAYGFVESGRVNPKTEELLTELSRREGWFVPVSTLLDYLLARQSRETRPFYERVNMELRWFLSKLVHKTS
jgi:hypothetical protein